VVAAAADACAAAAEEAGEADDMVGEDRPRRAGE
jgi:hypothetical protein